MPEPKPLRILLVNDDGVHAPGLHAAWQALKTVGEVFVCVPDRPRSACSHAITMHKALRVHRVETADGVVYSTNGMPGDCVPLAQLQLMEHPADLVVSGINHGANLGDDVIYSGTVAGAMEAILNGLPAFSISLVAGAEPLWTAAAEFTARLAGIMPTLNLPTDTFLNVNVPNLPPDQIAGVRITTQGSRRYKGDIVRFEAPQIGTYYWRGGEVLDRSERDDTDILAVKEGYISVTPLHVDLTRYDALDCLRDSLTPGGENCEAEATKSGLIG